MRLQEESDAQYKNKGKSSKAAASTSTALDAPQPADPSKPAAPQAEVAETDVQMQDVDTAEASAASSSDRKHVGEVTGKTRMGCTTHKACDVPIRMLDDCATHSIAKMTPD